MRFLYATNLHGARWKYTALLDYAVKKGIKWKLYLGDTLCVQPGQEGDLIFVEGDLETLEVERKVIPYRRLR